MYDPAFRAWLLAQGYSYSTQANYCSHLRKVERLLAPLDLDAYLAAPPVVTQTRALLRQLADRAGDATLAGQRTLRNYQSAVAMYHRFRGGELLDEYRLRRPQGASQAPPPYRRRYPPTGGPARDFLPDAPAAPPAPVPS